MSPEQRDQVARSLLDREYRQIFADVYAEDGPPFQIHAMREARGWTQKELAAKLGMTQTGVSRLESLSYGKISLTTLRRLAAVFDVGLIVKFVPFSQLIDEFVNLSPEALTVPSYERDPAAKPREN
jgi:transcriptional regulator with XRE-family HTH domain